MTVLDLPDAALPGVDHGARRQALRAGLEDAEVGALLVSHLPNVRWLTGFTGSNGQVVVALDPDRDLFVTDGRYDAQAAVEIADLERSILRTEVAEHVVARIGSGRLGFEAEHVDWRTGERLRAVGQDAEVEVVAVTGRVERLRAVKDEHELGALRAACALTDAAFDWLLEHARPGLRERELAVALERRMVDLGADGPSFPSIVAAGPHSAVPHHRPTDRELARGDLLKVDFGATYAGYHADMTRTVAMGDPGQQLRDLHDLVREAQRVGREAARAGASAGAVDAACRDVIAGAGFGEAFVHPTGHAVGLEIHEWPTLAAGAGATLEPGMAVTVEPGVYLAGTGGVRIEDTVVVTAAGPPDILTHSDRRLLTL